MVNEILKDEIDIKTIWGIPIGKVNEIISKVREFHPEWLKISEEREFNGLICRPIEQFGVAFKDIVIPDGWRLPTLTETVDLVNNADFVEWSKIEDEKHDFYIQQPFNKNRGKYAAGFDCGDVVFNIYGNGLISYAGRSRGVLLVKNK